MGSATEAAGQEHAGDGDDGADPEERHDADRSEVVAILPNQREPLDTVAPRAVRAGAPGLAGLADCPLAPVLVGLLARGAGVRRLVVSSFRIFQFYLNLNS